MHVDAVGDPTRTMLDVFLVAQRHFNIAWVYKNYRPPHALSHAFYWLWKSAAESAFDYFFYLEDDWELLQPASLSRMISIMEKHDRLATLRLPFQPTAENHSKNWKHYFPYNGEYFECPEDDKPHIGWCGHPGLVRKEFIQETMEHLQPDYCPERQMKGFWGNDMSRVIMSWEYGVYGFPNQSKYVQDIGRKWRAEQNIIKQKDTSWRIK